MNAIIAQRTRFTSVTLTLLLIFSSFVSDKKPAREYYQIRIYYYSGNEQETILDNYLASAFIPALHKTGTKNIGVFKPLANDTAALKKIYVFIPSPSLEKFITLPEQLQKDNEYQKAAKPYLEAAHTAAPFSRMEIVLLRAFALAPQLKKPSLTGEKTNRIYELRSYESATEKLYLQKVKMFNEGGEIALFDRLGFNAIFYADVVSGGRMPNLIYMTSFTDKADRDAHWKTFGQDPEWKRLSSLEEYKNTVSKADIILMHAASYSDL